jgi:hypothetical protein
MILDHIYFLRSVGDRAVHHLPNRTHLNPSLRKPSADLRHLLVFTSREAAERLASRINMGPSFYKVSVTPGRLITRQSANALPQACRPSFFVDLPQADLEQTMAKAC